MPKFNRETSLAVRYNDLPALQNLLHTFRGEVAGVLVESVQDNGPSPDYFPGVRRLCDEHGAVFILDEIKTGFRFGLEGAGPRFGAQPDLATFGKAMCNGYPAAVVVGKRSVLEKRTDTHMAATFHGDLLSVAAALTTIRVMKEQDGIGHFWRLGQRLMDGLNRVAREGEIPVKFIGFAPMPVLKPTDESDPTPCPKELREEVLRQFCAGLQRRGVFATPHPWFLSLSHTRRTSTERSTWPPRPDGNSRRFSPEGRKRLKAGSSGLNKEAPGSRSPGLFVSISVSWKSLAFPAGSDRALSRFARRASAGHINALHRLANPAPAALAGLFVVGRPLDLLGEALFLAHFLEPAEHLLQGLITTGLHLNHTEADPFIFPSNLARCLILCITDQLSIVGLTGCANDFRVRATAPCARTANPRHLLSTRKVSYPQDLTKCRPASVGRPTAIRYYWASALAAEDIETTINRSSPVVLFRRVS